MNALEAADRRFSEMLRPPPEPMPISRFAPTLKLADGPAAGQHWDPNSEPVQRIWVEAVTARKFRRFVAVCPSQRGKTLMAIILIWMWAVTQLRQSVGYVMPNLDKLAQNWVGKIEPTIRGAGFGAWLPQKGPGSKGGKPAVLTLRDPATGLIAGRSYFMATGKGGSETSVSSVSPAVILYDEADDAADAGQIELVFRRIESYGLAGLAVIASTVNDRVGRDDHPVLVIHSQGTRSRLHHRCPHCSGYFAPDFECFDSALDTIQSDTPRQSQSDAFGRLECASSINVPPGDWELSVNYEIHSPSGWISEGTDIQLWAAIDGEPQDIIRTVSTDWRGGVRKRISVNRGTTIQVRLSGHCTGGMASGQCSASVSRSGAIICPKCAVRWSEADRHAALNAAILVHQAPESQTFSLLTTGLDYHMARFDDIAVEYRAAKAAEGKSDFSLMRNHTHKVWCRAYEEPVADDEINNEQLSKVSERSSYDKRMVPEWAQFLTMAQDVQGDRHYWLVVAHGPGDRWAIVDWGYEFLVPVGSDGKPLRSPTPTDRVATLCLIRDLADTGWQVQGGDRRMRPVMRGVDIGYLTDEIVSWVQGEPAWKAVRGVGEDEAKHVLGGIEKTLPEEIRRTKALVVRKPPGWRVYWHKVDGHHFRRAAHAALLRDSDAIASGMLPRGLKKADMLCLHLSGEVWKDDKPGKPGYWFMARKRHDLLDCLIYALALALLHRYMPDRRDDGEAIPPPPRPDPTPDDRWIPYAEDATW